MGGGALASYCCHSNAINSSFIGEQNNKIVAMGLVVFMRVVVRGLGRLPLVPLSVAFKLSKLTCCRVTTQIKGDQDLRERSDRSRAASVMSGPRCHNSCRCAKKESDSMSLYILYP